MENANQAPQIVPLARQIGFEDSELTFRIVGGDLDDDGLAYSVLNPPSGATFDPANGQFRWTPAFDQAGNYSVDFVVAEDPACLATPGAEGCFADTETVKVRILDVNRTPVASETNHLAVLGQPLRIDLAATDPDIEDQNSLKFKLLEMPVGATLALDGQFSWTPGPGQSGDHLVLFQVTDGEDAISQSFVIRASLTPELPTVRIVRTPSFPVAPGETVLVTPDRLEFWSGRQRQRAVNGQRPADRARSVRPRARDHRGTRQDAPRRHGDRCGRVCW